jgi:hypothetical protein
MVVLEQRIYHTASDMGAKLKQTKPQELGEELENDMFQWTLLEVAVFHRFSTEPYEPVA